MNGLEVDMLPMEQTGDKVGFGILPLIESIGCSTPVFPGHGEVGRELCDFLRGCIPTNNVHANRLPGLLQAESPPSTTTGTLSFEWPAFEGSTESAEARTEGLCFYNYCVCDFLMCV